MSQQDRKAFATKVALSQADEEAEKLKSKLRFFREIGPLKRFGAYLTDGCPMCKVMGARAVRFCPGRERTEGIEADCLIPGFHLHCNCQSCGFVHMERVSSDEHELPGRGALCFDEAFEDGKVVEVEVPSAEVQWGLEGTEAAK